MKVEQFVVNINSEQPEKMVAFYRDIVGLEENPDEGPGAFKAGSSTYIALIIEGHSDVKGPTKEPQRVLLNFIVSDIAAEQQRLQAHGVEFIFPATEEPGFGIFATFLDPDGNYCQLFQPA